MDSARHVTFHAAGTPVTFPFPPYDLQREYVESVVTAATKRQNALLESPTGTGKTLSLLCASLAWQQNQTSSKTNSIIYYTSRTHLQLSQAAKEMKKTAYARVPAVVLASRNHMCLNDEVKQQSHEQDHSLNRACKNAIARNACQFYTSYENKLESRMDFEQVHDIEDLYNFARANQCCPYYASKKIAESKASLVFMPYNYLLDITLKKSTQLRLDDSIVIFDEGHNIESAFKDSASAQFKQSNLKTIQESCEKLPAKLSAALSYELHGLNRYGYDPEKRRNVVVDEFKKPNSKSSEKEKEAKPNPIEELAEKLTTEKLQQLNKCTQQLLDCQDLMKSKQGQYEDSKCNLNTIYEKFEAAGVNFATSDRIITTLESMATFWSIASVMNPSTVAKYLTAIENFSLFVSLLYPPGFTQQISMESHKKKLHQYYCAYIQGEFEKSTLMRNNRLIDWNLNLWCLHSAIGLKRVLDHSCVVGPRSIIITSGTLSPMHSMADELEIKFHIIKSFKHLIDDNQLKVLILGQSPSGKSLKSAHDDVKKPYYAKEMTESLLALFKMLPYGTLVFFPSYNLMRVITSFWENHSIFSKKLQDTVKVFKESKDQTTFSADMDAFKKLVDNKQRAVFVGVCRGKLSEGTNLEGNYCRSVIVVGLPFPNSTDPKIVETRQFHSKVRADANGSTWYTHQMRRALNQAFGRVIRSRNDFGMLFLCDPRFVSYRFGSSDWMLPFYPTNTSDDYKKIGDEIEQHFFEHDIDVTEFKGTNKVLSSQGGAFELDKVSKRNPLVQNRSINGQSSHKSVQAPNDVIVQEQQQPPAQRTVAERQADLIKAYTVAPAEYERIKKTNQKSRAADKQTNGPPANKRAKTVETTKDIFDSIAQHVEQPEPVSNTSGKCYICSNKPMRPCNPCKCIKVACYTCLRGLHNKSCGECKDKVNLRRFQYVLFSTKSNQ